MAKTSKSRRKAKASRREPATQITRRETRIVHIGFTTDVAKVVLALAALVTALAHAFQIIFR